MEDKIERLFEAIKPTNSHFSELAITELVDDITGNDFKRAQLLANELRLKLNNFIIENLNFTIKNGLSLEKYWRDKWELLSVRFIAEWEGYKYDYIDKVWQGAWIPYTDITHGMLPQLESFGDGDYELYEPMSQKEGFFPFIDPHCYVDRKWKAFRETSPIFEEYDRCIKDKEEIKKHGPFAMCLWRHGESSLDGWNIALDHMHEYQKSMQCTSQPKSDFKQKKKTKNPSGIETVFDITAKKSLLTNLHKLIDNKSGRESALPILAAKELKLMRTPTYRQFINEFGAKLVESEFNFVLNHPDSFSDRLVRLMDILRRFKK